MLGLLAKLILKTESALATVCNWKHFSNCLSSLSASVTVPPLASTEYKPLQKRMKPSAELSYMESQHPQILWAGQHRAHWPHDERALISSPLKEKLSWAHHTPCVRTWPGNKRGLMAPDLPHHHPPGESLSKLFTEFLCLRERDWAYRNQQAWNQHWKAFMQLA